MCDLSSAFREVSIILMGKTWFIYVQWYQSGFSSYRVNAWVNRWIWQLFSIGYLFHTLLSVFMVPWKKNVGSEGKKKRKAGEMNREEERGGWMEWMNNFISFKNLIILNFTDQYKFQGVEIFEHIEIWNIYFFLK